MSQQSASTELESTWGKFTIEQAAQEAQTKLIEAGIVPDKITLETEDNFQPVRLEDTGAIANLKSGAVTGAVLGALVGLSVSLVMTDFIDLGLAALSNFQPIHYFAPLGGAIVGAGGISLIAGLSGASIVRDDASADPLKKYLIVVRGTSEEIALAKGIIDLEGGLVEEADRKL